MLEHLGPLVWRSGGQQRFGRSLHLAVALYPGCMSSSTEVDLFAPTGHMTPERLRTVVEAFLAADFRYSVDQVPFVPPAPESFTADAVEWHVELMPPRRNVGVSLAVNRLEWNNEQDEPVPSAIEAITLSTSIHLRADDRTYGQEVLSWMALLATIVSPLYGAAGADRGGARYDVYDFPHKTFVAMEPQPLDWLTVYGPAYVAQMGLDRLLSAPCWRTMLLADRSVLLALAPHYELVDPADTVRVARHLGVPQRLHFGELFIGKWPLG